MGVMEQWKQFFLKLQIIKEADSISDGKHLSFEES